jgi:hypothetical protein
LLVHRRRAALSRTMRDARRVLHKCWPLWGRLVWWRVPVSPPDSPLTVAVLAVLGGGGVFSAFRKDLSFKRGMWERKPSSQLSLLWAALRCS